MSIQFFHEDVTLPSFDLKRVKTILKKYVLENHLKLGTINYIFCSDEYLWQLNKMFLDHDYYTDVITFDYTENLKVSGDIYISTERVKNNSDTFSQPYQTELLRVISHGLLHLLKYNDKDEAEIEIMRTKELELIQLILGKD